MGKKDYPVTTAERLMTELISGKRRQVFPPAMEPDEYGLVFVGADLSVETVIEAYMKGCFPWTGAPPIPRFSPDPRLVLYPADFHASQRLRRLARRKTYRIRMDRNFRAVMRSCAAIPRPGQMGTWITDNMVETYYQLHRLNIAHSVEVYDREDRLRGGLYGITLGRAFFGESMFSWEPNTSKLALFGLCRLLRNLRFHFIDCQQVTAHLMRLGAIPIRRNEYIRRLDAALSYETLRGTWRDRPIPPLE